MRSGAAIALSAILLFPVACATARTRLATQGSRTPPPDPEARTEYHAEPVVGRAVSQNILFLNHADASIREEKVAELLQMQYDFLRRYLGAGPEWIYCHTSAKYPLGFSIAPGAPGAAPWPEMFLQSGGIFHTEDNYAHEMTHCFNSYFGHFPHWFNESMADVTYLESEVYLWGRRREADLLKSFDRVDHRSYELMQLRARFGAGFFPKVYRVFLERLDECRRLFTTDTDLEDRNRFLIAAMSEAAGVDLLPLFEREFGFSLRTREKQRGYK